MKNKKENWGSFYLRDNMNLDPKVWLLSYLWCSRLCHSIQYMEAMVVSLRLFYSSFSHFPQNKLDYCKEMYQPICS